MTAAEESAPNVATAEEVALFRGYELQGEPLEKMDRYANSDAILSIALQRYSRDPDELRRDQYFTDDVVIMLEVSDPGLVGQMFGVYVQIGEADFVDLGRGALRQAYPDDEQRRLVFEKRLDSVVAEYGKFKRNADWKKLAADWEAAAPASVQPDN